MSTIEGIAYKNIYTKLLIQEIGKNNIAIIKHRGIDLVAAQDLKYKKIKAIINCENSIDLKYNIYGIKYLLDNNIKIFDVYDTYFFDRVKNGDTVCIKEDEIYVNHIFYTNCTCISKINILDKGEKYSNVKKKLFIENTLSFISNEMDYFLSNKNIPIINTKIKDREVIIISRGRDYRKDLEFIKKFIVLKKPVLIGVDGGADAIYDIGLRCDIIIGDMDSVSDRSLINCKEIIVHSYINGKAPGANRIKLLGLQYKLLPLKGTSEDAAIYLAQTKGATTIYLLGSHLAMDEFVEKGRLGMGSTALIRILSDVNIIDLKGINRLGKYSALTFSSIYIIIWVIIFIIFSFVLNMGILNYIRSGIAELINIK